jgi:TolB-like protein/AraC-like DNA-binding protein/Tfp pilus assembly protein PilF
MHREFIQKLTNLVEANLANESFGPEELAKEAGMSHSNLNRKLKAITIQNSSQFIREIRLKKARELLINEDLTVAEISYRVGFGSPTYFNNCFREYFGVAPGEMRNHKQESEPEEQPGETLSKKSNRTKLLIGLVASLALLIPLSFFLVNKYFFFETANIKDKSIAVLPFKYLSNDTINQYLADGMMDAILLNLSKIKDLRVISRTSVEQYRKSDKTAASIGREQDVAYLLEGSFQKVDNQIRLIVQLIRTKDEHHVWSDNYDRSWEDIFAVQSEVAEKVAHELQAAITPEEKQLIRKVPTINLTAYDYYQRGKDIYDSNTDSISMERARHLFRKALELDSTIALAYTGLAKIYQNKNFWKTYFSEDFFDSTLIFANKALTFDDKCSDAFVLKGVRYNQLGETESAIKEFNKAIKYNPNDHYAYRNLAFINREIQDDHVEGLRNLFECAKRYHGEYFSNILWEIGYSFWLVGHYEQAEHYYQEKLKLDGDSLSLLTFKAWIAENTEIWYQINKRIYESGEKSNISVDLINSCINSQRFEEAYEYAMKYVSLMEEDNEIPFHSARIIGYTCWKVGKTEDASYYFNLQKKISLESIEKGRINASRMVDYCDLAAVYAFQGDKQNAYKYLEELYKKKVFGKWWTYLIKEDPLFNSIRNEPRFQAVVKHIEAGFQAEHDRVGRWMAEQGML